MQLFSSSSFFGILQIIGAIKGKLTKYSRLTGIERDDVVPNSLTGNLIQELNEDEILT